MFSYPMSVVIDGILLRNSTHVLDRMAPSCDSTVLSPKHIETTMIQHVGLSGNSTV